ncbi:AraC family two component transcriptional regulator [Lachnotalea glycerini]|nr:response regulator [Lachnotalea glycerini]PXV85040.1 AraC family two component transcriptional regulator [Lachnotalea glycerini]
MSNYSVILVDDEEEVRQAIIKKINWNEAGFDVIGYAENGEEALELAENLRPDVIMTDIHMPFMDGLTMCRKLKEIVKNTKIIIFSGYDEFEYAREAIKLEVEEYILKPIDATQLKLVFERIKKSLDEEIEEKRNMERLKKYYYESLPVMKEQFMGSLLEGKLEEAKIEELRKRYDIDFTAPFYAVAVIRSEALNRDSEQYKEEVMYSQLIPVSLKQIVNENLENLLEYRSFIYLEWVVVIAMLGHSREITKLLNGMNQICKITTRMLNVNTSAGIGQACDSLIGLSHSYAGAKSAFEYRILLEPNQAIYIQDIEPKSEERISIDENEVQIIMKEIKVGSQEELQKSIHTLMAKVKYSKISIAQLQLSLMEIFVEIIRLGRVYEVDMEQITGEDFNWYQDISKFDTLDAVGNWLLHICMQVRKLIRRERTDTAKLITEKAIQYINENYSNQELSVDTICGLLNVSAAYFSTIFKKETGLGFVNYLTKVRMEQALRLLNTTSEKAYTIAGQVGYSEPNYFSYVFKKEYGISPSKYRASQVENNDK